VHASRETWRGSWHGARDSRPVLPVALATVRAPAAAGARLLALCPLPFALCPLPFALCPLPVVRGPRCAARVTFPTMVAAGAGGLDAERIYRWRWFD